METTPGEFTVKLEPHPARQEIHGVLVPIIKDQQQVMVNGVRVAYCGVEPGKPLCFIREYPPTFVELVQADVERQLGGPCSGVNSAPGIVEKPKPAKDEEEDVDDEDLIDEADDDFDDEPDIYEL